MPLLDAHGAHIASPLVDVLKELTMNCLQECQIVAAIAQEAGGLTQLDDPRLDEIVLSVAQCVCCRGADAVPQDFGAGDEVPPPPLTEIQTASRARTRRRARPRMQRWATRRCTDVERDLPVPQW